MVSSKDLSDSEKKKEKSLMRRVQGLKKKAKELSILSDVEACLIITDPSSSSSSSSLCYSWPEDLESCLSSVQRFRNFNHQKEMMAAQKKRKIDCLSSNISSTDKKLKKPMFDSSLSTDDLQSLLSMIDSKQESVEEKIRLLTENQPKEAGGLEQVQVLGSDHCETKGFEGLEMVSEMGNLIPVDFYDGFQFLASEVDSTQILLLDENKIEAHEVQQSDENLGFEGKIFEDLEMITNLISTHLLDVLDNDDDDYGLQCLVPEVDPTQIQLISDESEKTHDQVESSGCGEKDAGDSEKMISEYQNLNDMDYRTLMENNLVDFEQCFQGLPNTSDDHLMQGNCNFSGNYQTLNDSWQKLPQLI